jgi:hypothetical protein
VLVALCAMTDLVLIFVNIDLYARNNALGVYDALPSVVLHFPYDMIIVLTALALLQIFNLVVGNRKGSRAGAFLEGIKQRGTFRIRVIEYLALCVLAMMVFVFTGAAICATFTAWENALYDFRYVFLLIWVMLVPMANLIMLALKPEKAAQQKRTKLTVLSAWIGANLLFGLLFLILELTYPDFIVHIGKPLFLIAFSVSLPIEPGIILGIMTLGTLVAAIRMIMVAAKRNERA